MSSLVERLRLKVPASFIHDPSGTVKILANPDGPEAANEIERLQGLLAESLDYITPLFSGSADLRNRIGEALSLHKGGRDG